MGLLKWMRGDGDSPTTAMLAAGLGELSGVLQPGKRKQTELIQEQQNRREDISTGAPAGVDLDRGVAIIRARRDQAAERTSESTA